MSATKLCVPLPLSPTHLSSFSFSPPFSNSSLCLLLESSWSAGTVISSDQKRRRFALLLSADAFDVCMSLCVAASSFAREIKHFVGNTASFFFPLTL